MEITTELVEHLAKLSKLEFTKTETEQFKKEFAEILKHIDRIQEVDTNDINIEPRCLDAQTELREDEPVESINRDCLKKIAPEFERGSFVVPLVVE